MTKRFVWDGQQYLQQTDEADSTQALWTNEPDQYTNLVSQRRGAATHYPHFDALGSTRVLTDASQTITDTLYYDAWGNVLSQTGSTINPFLYVGEAGYYHDSETNSYYIRARIYEPRLTRWWSRDPLHFADGANRYIYASNVPTEKTDPLGLVTSCLPCGCATFVVKPLGQTCKPLTTARLRDIAKAKGIGKGLDGVRLNQHIGRLFQESVLNALKLKENFRRFKSPARAGATHFKRNSVQPDAVTPVIRVIIGRRLPLVFVDSAFVEVKAVKGSITMSHSDWQTLGFLDVLNRSAAALRGGINARPGLHYITTSDTRISIRVIQSAHIRKICLTQNIACELVPPEKDGRNIRIQAAKILTRWCAPSGKAFRWAFTGRFPSK